VAGGPYAIGLGTVAANTNYTIAFTGASLTVTPATLTVTADAKNKQYGDVDPPLTYTADGFKLTDTAATVLSGAIARTPGETVAGGPYPISQGTLVANANYTLTFLGANLSITARAITVTADAKSKTYGETDPALTYQVTTGALVGEDSFTGGLTRLAGEDVGSYAIQQGSLVLSGNYVLSFVGANLSITARAITVTADPKSKTYGEADPALTYQVTTGGLVSGDAFTGGLTRLAGEDVGSHAIQQGSLALSGNYTLTFVGANLSITARAITVTADSKTKTYGETDPALTYQVTTGALVSGDAFTGGLTRDAGQTVGSYAINQGTLALNANYTLTFVGANLTITARPVQVTADGQTKVYGEADPALTYQVTSGSLASGDAFAGAVTREAGQTVGNYAITQGSLALNANYTLTFVGASLTITARPIEVTAEGKTKVYGEVDPALTYQVTAGSLASGDAFSGGLTRLAGENVGSYAITQGTLALSGNYALTFAGANLSITTKAASVTPNAGTKVYGAADPALTGSLSGFLAGDAVTANYSRTAGETVLGSPYTISATLSPAGVLSNYNVTYNTAAFTITPKAASVTAEDKSKTYGDPNPVLTATVTGAVTGDTLSYALATTATQNSGVGGYSITVTPGLNPNYNVTPVSGTLTVTPATLTVSAHAKVKIQGTADPAFTYGVSGLRNGDTTAVVTGTLSRDPGEAVGKYPVRKGTLTVNSNYSLNYVGEDLTIVYSWSDVLQPINKDGSSIFKLGSTIPVKFQLTGASASTSSLVAHIYIAKVSNGVAGVEVEPSTNVNADAGNVFRYDASANQYIFNWGTKGLTEGTWQIRIDLGDGETHVVNVSLRK
jgi:large repetitive protein